MPLILQGLPDPVPGLLLRRERYRYCSSRRWTKWCDRSIVVVTVSISEAPERLLVNRTRVADAARKFEFLAYDIIEICRSNLRTQFRVLENEPFPRRNDWIELDRRFGEQVLKDRRSPGTCSQHELVAFEKGKIFIFSYDLYRECFVRV